jgi:hypothetical protein
VLTSAFLVASLRIAAPAILGVGIPVGLAAQAETPEAVTQNYLDAMRRRDWKEIATLTHPDAFIELRQLLHPLFESSLPEADDFRQEFLGVRTVDEAKALTDTTVFINFLRLMGERLPPIEDGLRRAVIEPIGHVARGDTAYVVYRSTTTVQAMPVSTLSVFSLRAVGDTWRAQLTADFTSLATALRQALGG